MYLSNEAKLRSVNTILSHKGLRPVSVLDPDGPSDAGEAERMVDAIMGIVSVDILSRILTPPGGKVNG